jgi:hypothetical protein
MLQPIRAHASASGRLTDVKFTQGDVELAKLVLDRTFRHPVSKAAY